MINRGSLRAVSSRSDTTRSYDAFSAGKEHAAFDSSEQPRHL